MQLPYTIIRYRAMQLIDLIALTMDHDGLLRKEYLNYLSECGWSESEFDKEFMKEINSNWNTLLN